MSTLSVTAFSCPNDAAADLEAMTLPLCSEHASLLQAWVPVSGPNVLDEPSSLPFGVKRVAKPVARSRAAQVKPRRRAA